MSSPPLPEALPFLSSHGEVAEGGLPGAVPTDNLPQQFPPQFPPFLKFVRSGCWLANYKPFQPNLVVAGYSGTIRVESSSAGRLASGDLYRRAKIPRFHPPEPISWSEEPAPDPANGIPILSRDRYTYYVVVTKISDGIRPNFTLGLDLYRYSQASITSYTFVKEDSYTAEMTWMPAPAGYPSAGDYAAGTLKSTTTGLDTGRLTLGWLSTYYRKATLEIDTEAGSERPLNNGAGEDWKTIFDRVGWDFKVKLSDINVPEEHGPNWSEADLHKAMLDHREAVDLDKQWAYYLLAVKNFNISVYGVMFDYQAADTNQVPREGCAVGSHVQLDNDPRWGVEANKRFGLATKPYFRTACHELGHGLGLLHDDEVLHVADNSFMNKTVDIIAKATAANPFDNLIKWNYADGDLKLLRHWPDPFVRPGGVSFGSEDYSRIPDAASTDATVEIPGLTLEVEPLLREVPLGAPVRVNVKLTNRSSEPITVPRNIGLSSPFVYGKVTDVAGTERTFSRLVCLDRAEPVSTLKKDESVSASLTLFGGGQGPLFPVSGVARVEVSASWSVGTVPRATISVTGSSTVMVTPPLNASHAAAAHSVLSTPDVFLVLVLGGDHLEDGLRAVDKALKDDTLRPHFAAVGARRLATNFGTRRANLDGAKKLLESGDIILSSAEEKKLEKLGVKAK